MEKRQRRTKKAEIDKGKETCWLFKEKCLEQPPEGYIGYIYLITNNLSGKFYVGKKSFVFRKKTKLSKKARKGTRKRVNISYVDSGWKDYWGSSKELLEDIEKLGKDNFTREILMFCENKSLLSYYELFWQIKKEVMFKNSYNNWINCKIFKKNLVI